MIFNTVLALIAIASTSTIFILLIVIFYINNLETYCKELNKIINKQI